MTETKKDSWTDNLGILIPIVCILVIAGDTARVITERWEIGLEIAGFIIIFYLLVFTAGRGNEGHSVQSRRIVTRISLIIIAFILFLVVLRYLPVFGVLSFQENTTLISPIWYALVLLLIILSQFQIILEPREVTDDEIRDSFQDEIVIATSFDEAIRILLPIRSADPRFYPPGSCLQFWYHTR